MNGSVWFLSPTSEVGAQGGMCTRITDLSSLVPAVSHEEDPGRGDACPTATGPWILAHAELGKGDAEGSGSSAFVEQMQRTDRSKPFVLNRAAGMGRNAQYYSKYCSQYSSKFTIL
jgi:hypothetical protein